MEEDKQENKEQSREKERYRRKLDMLGPGSKMLMCTGILCGAAIILYLIGLKIIAYCVAGAAGILFLVLLILLKIESHQDRARNDTAEKDREKN